MVSHAYQEFDINQMCFATSQENNSYPTKIFSKMNSKFVFLEFTLKNF